MSVAVAEDTLIGSTLAEKYRIVRQIGRGGMGVVYEAEHIDLGKRVAIKLMLEKYAEDREAISRFKREALAASRIGNPHIIDISDIGIAPDGRSFVVMELLRGCSLADLIKGGGAIAPPRAIDIMRQTLRAVGAAHAKGIIHRDLKPDNIFLVAQDDDRDFVKLLDFGISKVVDQAAELAATKLTSTGTVMGTPLYMAPEQAMGTVTDQRADIYALGVIMYEMLGGKPPFDGVTYPVLVVKLLTVDPELLSTVRPGLPPPVVAAVHRALEKEPAARFASCEAFAAALGGESARNSAQQSAAIALDRTMNSGDGPAVAMPSSLKRPTGMPHTQPLVPAKRSSLPIVLAAVGGAVVVGAVVLTVLLTGRSTPDAPPPSQQTITAIPVAPPVPAPVPAVATPEKPPTPSPIDKTVKPAPKKVAAAPAPVPLSPTPPAPTPTVNTPPPAPGSVTTDDVQNAIKRHDGKACRAALAALTSPPPTDFRVASLHAVCEMVAGNCDAGTKEQEALYTREGSPPSSAKYIADIYCPITGVAPDVRLRRLSKQMSMFSNFDCDYYLGPTREAAKVAASDSDRRTVGSLLAGIATCYSRRDKCDVAKKVLAEAQVFIPALQTNELTAACR